MSFVSTQTQNKVLLGKAEFWELKDDESFSTCTTVVISNQEDVPSFTEEELKSRVEAVFEASEDVVAATNLVSSIFVSGKAGWLV